MSEKYIIMESDSFDLNQFQICEKIGGGSFGVVYKVREIKTGVIYAAKISLFLLECDELQESQELLIRNIVREVNIISKINHPAIVKFIGFSPFDFNGDLKPTIISEYITKGNLTQLLDNERRGCADIKWNDTQKLITLYGIASAMAFLHENKIIHRDLKPDNILMDDDLYPKLTDFGLSKIIHSNNDSMSFESVKGFKGTILYSPPEMLNDFEFSQEGDVYSFSMIAYEIMTNEKPFEKCKMNEIMMKLVNGDRPTFNSYINGTYKSLIERCWSQDPSDRPTFAQIIDEMKNDPGFITDIIDENIFLCYVDYIDDYKVSFQTGKSILSYKEFIESRKINEVKKLKMSQLQPNQSQINQLQPNQSQINQLQSNQHKLTQPSPTRTPFTISQPNSLLSQPEFHQLSPNNGFKLRSSDRNGFRSKTISSYLDIKKSVNKMNQIIFNDPQFELNKFSWYKNHIIGCTHENNPYIDKNAILISEQSNSYIYIFYRFTYKLHPIHFQKIEETVFFKQPIEDQNVLILSDVTDKSNLPSIQKIGLKNLPNIADYFYSKNPSQKSAYKIEDIPFKGSNQKFINLELNTIKMDFEIIEPLFFGAFLIQYGSIISEQWTFSTKDSIQFIPNISLNKNALFELPSSYENAYLCIVVSRFLLPENGSTVNSYYQKPSQKAFKLAKTQAMHFNKFIGVYAPFALTYINLKTVIENKYFDFPQPFVISQQLSVIIKQIKTGFKISNETYPIYIAFKSDIFESSKINENLKLNSINARLTLPLPLKPCYLYRHRLLVKINQAILQTSFRNIFAELKINNEYGDIPLFTTSYSNEKTSKTFTRCWYHEKKPCFDELFIINIPSLLPKSLTLTVSFFNVSLKNLDQIRTDFIGNCTIQLYNDEIGFIIDGKHNYTVDCKGYTKIGQSTLNITTQLDSCLISSDKNLNDFYETFQIESLQKCSEREIIINLFPIIDKLLDNMKINGQKCMQSFAILSKKNFDWKTIEKCLNDYSIHFFYMGRNYNIEHLHYYLLFEWHQFLLNNPNSNQLINSQFIGFFFNIMIKSIYIKNERDFSYDFINFVTQWSKILDYQQINDYARFLNLLFDTGSYFETALAIENQIDYFLYDPSKYPYLIYFISQVFKPKLFYETLMSVNIFKTNIIYRIISSQKLSFNYLNSICRIFLCLFAYYSDEMKQKIADAIVNTLEILSYFDDINAIPNDDDNSVIYYYCFILSCISPDVLVIWIKEKVEIFFKAISLTIEKNIKGKEFKLIVYLSILRALSIIAKTKELKIINESLNIIYQFLNDDLPLDFFCPLMNELSKIINENFIILINNSVNCLTKLFSKLHKLSFLAPDEYQKLLNTFFEADKCNNGNMNISHEIYDHAIRNEI